jgi:hypothetical protein
VCALKVLLQVRMLLEDEFKHGVRVCDQLKIPFSRFIVAAEFPVMIDVFAHLTDAR